MSRKKKTRPPNTAATLASFPRVLKRAAYSGGYTGGQYAERFTHWSPGEGDADYHISRDLISLRARSHDVVRNSPVAAGAVETQVTHVVGTGLTFQSTIDAEFLKLTPERAAEWEADVNRQFHMFAESRFCDTTEEQNFYGLQDLVFRSALEGGDVFIALPEVTPPPGWPYSIRVQLIEADRVGNPSGVPSSGTVVQGIAKDATGKPIGAWVADRSPVSLVVGNVSWRYIPFRGAQSGRLNLIHFKRKLRPGQTRGIPALAPIIALIKQIDRFANAEVDAAVNSAAHSLFVKMDASAFETLYSDDEDQAEYVNSTKGWDGTVSPGMAVNLLPGESIESPSPGRPNPEFEPFFEAVMKQIGIGINVPFEVLAKHFKDSYSAARAALLDAWRTFRIRREALAADFCQLVYEEWLSEAVASGRIRAPGFFRDPMIRRAWCGSVWSGDGPGALDPTKEVDAVEKRLRVGLTTLAEEVVAYDGGDWKTKHSQRIREVEARREAKLEPELQIPQPAFGTPAPRPERQRRGSNDEDAA